MISYTFREFHWFTQKMTLYKIIRILIIYTIFQPLLDIDIRYRYIRINIHIKIENVVCIIVYDCSIREC